jgi:hypothetical protein
MNFSAMTGMAVSADATTAADASNVFLTDILTSLI